MAMIFITFASYMLCMDLRMQTAFQCAVSFSTDDTAMDFDHAAMHVKVAVYQRVWPK